MTRGPEPGRINIRSRIAIAVVLLVGCALTLVGITLNSVERASTEREVAARLARAANEFATLATEGVDPATGRAFESATRLLEVALQRTALGPTEGELGLVNGHVRWSGLGQLETRPENDAELLAHVTPLADLNRTSHGDVTTAVTHYRYVVVPVLFEASGERGGVSALPTCTPNSKSSTA